ncbi:hypothetical protein N7540_004082 [Penicillium herquei]|nr:hypothetical protein N7540_004082 [Penicillium herquei]
MMTSRQVGLDGWDKPRFEAFTKLLLLKSGRQVEEASEFVDIPSEETETSDLKSIDSVNVDLLSQFNEDKLKRAFLDRISELVANGKGGHHVSSSLMIEWPDRVDVLVSRNAGLKKTASNVEMLETIASNLRRISTLDRRDLESFQVQINDASRLSTEEGVEESVLSAYDICHNYDEQDFEIVSDKVVNAKKLGNALGFLGRLNTCFKTLIRASERLPGFQGLQIIPVTVLPAGRCKSKENPKHRLSLAKTFSALGLNLDDQTVKSLFKARKRKGPWTKRELLKKFDELKSPDFQVHAEVQVLLAATRHDCTGASIFKYVGCSKRSCFLCYNFIRRYGQFDSRGCHGKLWDLWTVHEVSWLAEESRLRLVKILEDIEKDIKESLLDNHNDKHQHAPESTIGGSSIATVRPHFENPYTMSLASRHLEAQWANIIPETRNTIDLQSLSQDLSGEDGLDTDIVIFLGGQEQNIDPAAIPESMLERQECHSCGKETFRRCMHCNRDWFCGQKCQGRMSLDHLAKCSARSITTADILFDDVIKDKLPKDEGAREAFGFNRCSHWREEFRLLGLYRGLLLFLHDREISPVELDKWQENGTLTREIIERFHAIPEHSRGGYFPWFLRNQHVLDNSTPVPQLQGPEHPILRALDAARPYLEPEDRDKDLCELQPIEKRYSFLFYALALDSSVPNPNWVEFDLWYDFGFALCTDEYYETNLGALYSKLVGGEKFFRDYDTSLGIFPDRTSSLPTCSFDEFWRAWRDGSMADLFDKYGLGDGLDRGAGYGLGRNVGFHHLRDFMAFPVEKHKLRPSVWRLKHLLALDDNTPLTGFPKIEGASQEYGFTPQLDARTRINLRQFYKQLLNICDPLEVHRAKESGELLGYAESLSILVDERVRGVLRKMDSTKLTPRQQIRALAMD